MEQPLKQSIRFDRQGRALIPKALREAIGVGSGGEVIAWLEEGRLVLESRAVLLERLKARYRDVEGSMADELIRERRKEAAREEQE
jgi:bifunctional DNA-binding transcriptional regulator/antitoxin component of YhaV-PrlF toxin-antitoxin module